MKQLAEVIEIILKRLYQSDTMPDYEYFECLDKVQRVIDEL